MLRVTPRRWALLWVALGHVGMAAWVSDPRLTLDPGRAILFEAMPIPVRVALWASAALAVTIGALWPRMETAAYVVAVVMPLERAAGHAWSWAHHLIPGGPPGDRLGWGPALLWLSVAALIILVGRSTTQEGD